MLESICSTNYSLVYRWIHDGITEIIKIVKRRNINILELDLLQKIEYKNFVNCKCITLEPSFNLVDRLFIESVIQCSLTFHRYIFIVMDEMISLDNICLIDNRKKLYFELISSVLNLHELGFIHNDIGVRNIFMDEFGTTKLGDFGSCSLIGEVDDALKCAVEYRAPEYFILKKNPTIYADIWSIGMTILELETGYKIVDENLVKVFKEDLRTELTFYKEFIFDTHIQRIIDSDKYMLYHKCREFSSYVKLYKDLNTKEIRDLIIGSIKDIELREIVDKMLKFNPLERANLKDILSLPYFNEFVIEKLILKESNIIINQIIIEELTEYLSKHFKENIVKIGINIFKRFMKTKSQCTTKDFEMCKEILDSYFSRYYELERKHAEFLEEIEFKFY